MGKNRFFGSMYPSCMRFRAAPRAAMANDETTKPPFITIKEYLRKFSLNSLARIKKTAVGLSTTETFWD